jgi:hypothetical protein
MKIPIRLLVRHDLLTQAFDHFTVLASQNESLQDFFFLPLRVSQSTSSFCARQTFDRFISYVQIDCVGVLGFDLKFTGL